MDSLLVWNIRGLNALNKQQELHLLCAKMEVEILGLVETKLALPASEACKKKWFCDWNSV